MKPDVILNHVALTYLARCPRMYDLYCLRAVRRVATGQQEIGIYIHKFIEENVKGKTAAQFLSENPSEQKEVVAAVAMLNNKFDSSAVLRINDVPVVEWQFGFKIAETERANYHLFGTIDLALVENGYCSVYDHKTTSIATKDVVLRRYANDIQIPLYCYVLSRFTDVPITGGYYHIIQTSKMPPVMFMSPLVKPNDHAVETVLENAIATVERILAGRAAPPNGMLNGSCGTCQFSALCSVTDTEHFNQIVESMEKEVYDPRKWR